METRALMILFLVIMMILTCQFVSVTCAAQQHNLKKMTGYKLTGPALSLVSRPDMDAALCAVSCQATICKSAAYSSIENWCMTFKERYYETSITISVDSNWNSLYLAGDEDLQYGNWTLVFRGQSLIQKSVYDAWMGTGVYIDEISEDCSQRDNTRNCTQHFRSQILDNWVDIDQVRFSLYKNGVEVKYIMFDGTNTDKVSWFSQSKVLESSWPGLAPTAQALNYYSPKGCETPGICMRRFYTSIHYGCGGDVIYTTVLDATYDGCQSEWLLPVPNFPLFMYSPNTSYVIPYQDGYELADIMAVFVKFK